MLRLRRALFKTNVACAAACIAAVSASSMAIAPATHQARSAPKPAVSEISRQDIHNLALSCIPTGARTASSYGIWREVRSCSFAGRGAIPAIPIDALLVDSNGDVKGFRRMVVNPQRLEQLRKVFTSSTSRASTTCSRLGQAATPLFVSVHTDLCDALTYSLL